MDTREYGKGWERTAAKLVSQHPLFQSQKRLVQMSDRFISLISSLTTLGFHDLRMVNPSGWVIPLTDEMRLGLIEAALHAWPTDYFSSRSELSQSELEQGFILDAVDLHVGPVSSSVHQHRMRRLMEALR